MSPERDYIYNQPKVSELMREHLKTMGQLPEIEPKPNIFRRLANLAIRTFT